jgi:hypothetical protein
LPLHEVRIPNRSLCLVVFNHMELRNLNIIRLTATDHNLGESRHVTAQWNRLH